MTTNSAKFLFDLLIIRPNRWWDSLSDMPRFLGFLWVINVLVIISYWTFLPFAIFTIIVVIWRWIWLANKEGV